MAKIYVSSTFLDLEQHRAQVEKVIRRMGHEDVAMEYYVAEDQRPVAKCLADVANCDVYIGIFAWRYGWQPKGGNADQHSITEMEFRQAENAGKPCLIFLLSDDAPWPRKHMDRDTTKIEALRNEASARHTADWFASPDELARKVAEAIYKQIPAAVPIPELNLDKYYEALRKRYGVLALEGLTPPQKEEYLQIQLSSVFVELGVRENPPPVELPKGVWDRLFRDKEFFPDDLPFGITIEDIRRARDTYYEKPSRPVLDVLTDSRYRRTVILGDPGSGKSTLARYVILSLIDSRDDEKLQHVFVGFLPLLLELRSYAGLCADKKCESFLEFLEYLGKTEGWGLTQNGLHNYLKANGRAIIVFDGLDEIFEPEQREHITRQIVGFVSDYPKVHVIVTSRIIGYRRKILADAGFSHFTLQDLDNKQVQSFVTRWYDLAMSDHPDEAKERCERILRSFKESISIRQLASNPMLLTIMAIIGKHQELPRERWKLYDHAASVLIQHWDVNKHLKAQNVGAGFIGEDDKKELLRRLAFQMQGGVGGLAGNYIHREQLQAEFETYLRERYSQGPDRAVTIARVMIDQFRERNFILSLYGAKLYGFVHRAFLEYFSASMFVYKFEKTKELTIQQLKNDVYGAHWEDQSWHEVLRLICGMIDEKWSGEIIDDLRTRKPRPSSKMGKRKFDDVVREVKERTADQKIGLAVQCLAEVRNLSSVAETASHVLEMVLELCESSNYSYAYNLGIDYEIGMGSILKQQVIPAAELIGANWPNREILSNWLRRRHPLSDSRYSYSEEVGTFVGLIGSGHNSTYEILLEYIDHQDACNRILSLAALTKGWYFLPQIPSKLRHSAVNDEDPEVRLAAIRLLIKDFQKDQENVSLVYDLAIKDENSHVRREILLMLVDNFRDPLRTLILVHDRASNDPNHLGRADAIISLARNWPDHPNTLSLLKQCAQFDPDLWVRSVAMNLIKEFEAKSDNFLYKHPHY